jgi:hypothetical protein
MMAIRWRPCCPRSRRRSARRSPASSPIAAIEVHNAPRGKTFNAYIASQQRRVTEAIKRESRNRSAVEPVIGHAKAEHRMGCNFLNGAHGDAANAVLVVALPAATDPPKIAQPA